MRTRTLRLGLPFGAVLGTLLLMLLAGAAAAVHEDGFQLEGNAAASDLTYVYNGTPGTLSGDFAGPIDWDSIFEGGPAVSGGAGATSVSTGWIQTKASLPSGDWGSITAAAASTDFGLTTDSKNNTVFDSADSTTYTLASKDTKPVSGWTCVSANNVTDKGDITNAYVALMAASGGSENLYFGLEKTASNGDNNVGIWLLQDSSVACSSSGTSTTFGGQHTDGDIFLVSEFTNGGVVSSINAYRWNGDDTGSLSTTPFASGQDCHVTNAGDELCATTNGKDITVPWLNYFKGSGLNQPEGPSAFFEGGINLSAFSQFTSGCFTKVLFNTRSSQELGATLYDYTIADLNTCATKSGTKFEDLNANGVKDAGEPGIAGWPIYLLNAAGTTVVQSTTTDSNGDYAFNNIVPGSYKVCEAADNNTSDSTTWYQSYPKTGTTDLYTGCTGLNSAYAANGYAVTLATNANDTGNDFGNYQMASKSGMKFEDMNANGVKDAGDTPVSGVTIKLLNAAGTSVVQTTTTAATTGAYSFTGITPGSYLVCEFPSAGWTQSAPSNTACSGVTGAAPGGYAITLTSGQSDTGNDFGNYQMASKSGMKFEDMNANGVKDAGDTPVSGVTIKLLNAAGTSVVQTTTTAATTGAYSFTGITPGSYLVCEFPSAGWTQSAPSNTACSGVTGAAPGGYAITLTSGQSDTGNDFGNWRYASKSGFKFQDQNANGSYDPLVDTLIQGWRFDLWDVTTTPAFVSTTTTGINGGYSFGSLMPGKTYVVCEQDPTSSSLVWYQSYPNGSTTAPAGESIFDCSTLTSTPVPYMHYGYQFAATSGAGFVNNIMGNYPVAPGCTLTQGYWKTHSTYGPAAHPDATWDQITAAMTGGSFGSGPDSEFFTSGLTWYQVFTTNPKGGNAWYILAHQYMAAVLNQLDGAGDVPGLSTTLSQAYTILGNYATAKDIGKKDPNRDVAISLATFLNNYNNGLLGVPHCGEPGMTTYPMPLG